MKIIIDSTKTFQAKATEKKTLFVDEAQVFISEDKNQSILIQFNECGIVITPRQLNMLADIVGNLGNS